MWIITLWQCISPEVTVKGFKKCCTSTVVDGIDDDMLCNGSEEDGNVRKMTVKMETRTLNGKGLLS